MSATIIRSPSMGDHRVRLSSSPLTHSLAPSAAGQERAELERKIRAEIQQDFDSKLAEASDQARKEGFAQGHEEGLAEGRTEGLKAGRATWDEHLHRVEDIISKAETSIKAYWDTTVGAVEDLAFKAVCMLMGEHALEPGVVVGMVRQLTARLQDADVLGLRLHPAECAQLRKAISSGDHALQLALGRLVERLIPDPSLEAGGCVIETPRGEYCGSLDVQLTHLRRVLVERREQASSADRADDGVVCA